MRLYVPHDERRPQPAPAATNDALAFAVGLGGWLIGLAVVGAMVVMGTELVMGAELDAVRVFSTIGVGLLLGALGMLVSARRR